MYELNESDYKAVLDLVTALVKVKSVSAFSEMLVNAKELLNFENVTLVEIVFHKTCTQKIIFSDDKLVRDLSQFTVSQERFDSDSVYSDIFLGREVIKTVRSKDHLSGFYREYFPDVEMSDFQERTLHILSHLNKETNTADVIIFTNVTEEGSEKFDAMAGYLHAHLMSAYVRIMSVRDDVVGKLSERELSVLTWLKFGKTSWEVAKILNITENTVNFHIKNIKRKLNATNRQHAVAIAIAKGIIE